MSQKQRTAPTLMGFSRWFVLAAAIVNRCIVKSVYEAVATPLMYKVVNFLKRQEGMEVYDTDTRFNPLLATE